MGLSPLLHGEYLRYKRDTKTITQWLGATAQSTSLANDVLKRKPDVGTTTSINKNRKRRGIRKEAIAYKITAKAYVKLAKAINHSHTTKVPRYILNVLKDTIATRKQFARDYNGTQQEKRSTTERQEDGHQHFIEILESVFELLAPLEEERGGKAIPHSQQEPEHSNSFYPLDVEECLDVETDTTWVPVSTKKVTQDTYELETSPEDISFAVYCFMKDLTNIRIFIRRTWREYKHKHITLNTAAVTVNTAIDVIRRLNEEFIEDHPVFAEHNSLVEFLSNGYVDANSRDLDSASHLDFIAFHGREVHLSWKAELCKDSP